MPKGAGAMKRKFFARLFIGLLVMTLTSAQSIAFDSFSDAQQSPAPEISDEFDYTADFVAALKAAGLSVQKVARSTWEGTFKDENKAAFIETDKGVVEVVIFTGAANAEKIRITSYMTNSDGPATRYKYRLKGAAMNGGASRIDAAYPVYFTMYKNWFIITMKSEMDVIIKSALARR
jgi:hypothetical protein